MVWAPIMSAMVRYKKDYGGIINFWVKNKRRIVFQEIVRMDLEFTSMAKKGPTLENLKKAIGMAMELIIFLPAISMLARGSAVILKGRGLTPMRMEL